MAMRFGINGGDSGDQFMDAPPPGASSGRSRSGGSAGENPLSSFLNLVGIHIGESNSQKNAIEKGTAPSSVASTPVSQGSSNIGNLNPAPPVYDSQGNYVGNSGMPTVGVPQVQVDSPNVPAPTPLHSFLGSVGRGILGGNESDSSSGGSLGKTIMKIIGL